MSPISILLDKVPQRVREKLPQGSNICLLSGKDLFGGLAADGSIVMACNPRIPHVIPGIMRAAEEMDAVVAFELTKTEGGIDGGYTGQTPLSFFETVISCAEASRFSKPFVIHADHVTIAGDTPADAGEAAALLDAQLEAGYTSFALDASFHELSRNVEIISPMAARITGEGYGLEVELGEPKGGEAALLTEPEEAEEFLSLLTGRGITPQLLAINNGSKKGNYLEGEPVGIDLERTAAVYAVAERFGLCGLVQHGITGTPLRIVGKLAEYGIRKGNIGTLWQNVAHAGLPLDLMDAMRQWARENRTDIKYATAVFKADIDAIPQENIQQIHDMAYREAKEFIQAFRSRGSASRLAKALESA